MQDGTTPRIELADLEDYRSIPSQGMATGIAMQQIIQQAVETKQEVIQPKTTAPAVVQNKVLYLHSK